MLERILQVKEIIELINKHRKAVFRLILVGLVIVVLFLWWLSRTMTASRLENFNIWNSIQPGDSIYVRENVFYLDFYKKGREKLSDYEQKEINYRSEDSINFISQNSVHEKFFYQNRTSFAGICIAKDSTITRQGEYSGHRWIKIEPSYEITHPPNPDEYDFEARTWEGRRDDFRVNGMLSKEFYVHLDDVTNINNDSTFCR